MCNLYYYLHNYKQNFQKYVIGSGKGKIKDLLLFRFMDEINFNDLKKCATDMTQKWFAHFVI